MTPMTRVASEARFSASVWPEMRIARACSDARRLQHRDGAQRQGRLFGFDLLGLGLRRGAAHGGEFAGAHPCGESDQHDEPQPAYGT